MRVDCAMECSKSDAVYRCRPKFVVLIDQRITSAVLRMVVRGPRASLQMAMAVLALVCYAKFH